MKVRTTLLASRLDNTTKVNFKEDASTVVEEIETFDSRVSAGHGASFKYPNVELKRCFDAKNFRHSNSLVSRMLSTRATVAKHSNES
jgi:hypothetical protein